jgi:hypothetical protein
MCNALGAHTCTATTWAARLSRQARPATARAILRHAQDVPAVWRHAACPLQGGAESGATPTDFRFTGQRKEAGFGLYDFNARRVARPDAGAVRERGYDCAGRGQAAELESVCVHVQ